MTTATCGAFMNSAMTKNPSTHPTPTPPTPGTASTATAPLPRVGLPQPDRATRLGQPVRAAAPRGNPAEIDALLEKHGALAKHLKRLLDLLKPQDKVRVRYQEDGSPNWTWTLPSGH
jgi:hypothetical protein